MDIFYSKARSETIMLCLLLLSTQFISAQNYNSNYHIQDESEGHKRNIRKSTEFLGNLIATTATGVGFLKLSDEIIEDPNSSDVLFGGLDSKKAFICYASYVLGCGVGAFLTNVEVPIYGPLLSSFSAA